MTLLTKKQQQDHRNVTRAAEKVGLQRTNFQALMKKHHITLQQLQEDHKADYGGDDFRVIGKSQVVVCAQVEHMLGAAIAAHVDDHSFLADLRVEPLDELGDPGRTHIGDVEVPHLAIGHLGHASVGLGDAGGGAAIVDGAADHAHAGAVAEDVVGVARGDAARGRPAPGG